MSTEFPSQWQDVLHRAGIQSYGQLAERAGLPKPTVWAAVTGRSKTYRPATVTGLAKAARISEENVSELLGMGRQPIQPYTPPAEAAYLDTRQRAAVDEMIRLLVQPSTTSASAPTEQEEPSEPASAATPDSAVAYDDIAQAKLAQALQSDYTPAASPHEQPDPHNGVGEGNQDR